MPEQANLHATDLSATTAPRSRWRADLALVVALALGCYALSSAFELNESLSRWLAGYERWQADELPLSMTVLAAGLAWFAWRRQRETLAGLHLREQAESRITELLTHNRELARQLIAVQENERRALARELHDELGQACSAIRLETAYIRHCDGAAHDGIALAAARADAEAQRLYELVRDMLKRLRPLNLDTLGLVAALQELCESWEERTGVSCVFHHQGVLQALGDDIDITVYRVTQEALTNVTRHAQASSVRVQLARGGAGLSLLVTDDGRGIDPSRSTEGLGLLGASERAAALGGRLQVGAGPSAGVQLALHLPLAEARP